MQAYPHHYQASAQGAAEGIVEVGAHDLAPLPTAAPPEFDGPGGAWSPETLLLAALADCFVLTLRSVSRAARFEWRTVQCRVEGVLDRVAGVAQFCRFTTRAKLAVPPGANREKARELLERAEKFCLIGNSLRGERLLQIEIVESDA
ncbi:MAG TPA: OsmC family protein [Steroidobacteraceae bacterium]|nr:OsmC family protein [Steroidobacteraceae bacterium]